VDTPSSENPAPDSAPSSARDSGPSGLVRCSWAGTDPLMVAYHDDEWGVPVHDDHRHFELLTLEGAQAGLSWTTILRKREGYRRCFEGFDPQRVANFDDTDVQRLLDDPAIVRHRGKIESTVSNAGALLAVAEAFGTFDEYVWAFVGGRPIVGDWDVLGDLPSATPESVALSRDLKRRGFRFVGPTTVYAYLQAAGLVDDHVTTCFRRSA
jgi:DNA-3-methyladenine glycosylase I